jgi:serine/threonine-protein kinase
VVTAPVRPESLLDQEALFREARRRRHRRWGAGLVVVAVLAGGVSAYVIVSPWGPTASARHHSVVDARALPIGPLATLSVAGALAVGPTGDLYVTDVARNRILLLLPDGRFRVVVGNGQTGFSGDGRAAIDAELSGVSDLASAPDGSLYVADGARVRVVSPDGVIRTVAGNGLAGTTVADGTPALSAALAPLNTLSIALSPNGQLYLSTGNQLLRLSNGRLETIRAVVPSGVLKGPLDDLGQIAVDGHGNIDVSGYNGWAIWQVAPTGVATEVGPPEERRSGGDTSVLERAPDGAVYGESGPTLHRIDGQQLVAGYSFTQQILGQYFFLTHFAFAPDGTVYADDIPGGTGFEANQQLVSVTNAHEGLLWQESNPAAK